jgi:hypothetical protein
VIQNMLWSRKVDSNKQRLHCSAFDGVQITNSTDISSILSYHTVNGTHMTSQFKDGSNILATNLTNSTYDHFPSGGVPVDVKVSNSLVNVYYGANYANVTSADNSASNGVVHIINAVSSFHLNFNGLVRSLRRLTHVIGSHPSHQRQWNCPSSWSRYVRLDLEFYQ